MSVSFSPNISSVFTDKQMCLQIQRKAAFDGSKTLYKKESVFSDCTNVLHGSQEYLILIGQSTTRLL